MPANNVDIARPFAQPCWALGFIRRTLRLQRALDVVWCLLRLLQAIKVAGQLRGCWQESSSLRCRMLALASHFWPGLDTLLLLASLWLLTVDPTPLAGSQRCLAPCCYCLAALSLLLDVINAARRLLGLGESSVFAQPS